MKYRLFLLIMVGVFLSACNAPKKVLYFQDAAAFEQDSILNSYDFKIQPDDQLSIVVNSKFPELSLPFNLAVVSYQIGSTGNLSGNQRLQGYIVDADGNINFPQLGVIKAAGLTRSELTEYIQNRLKTEGYINDAVVTINPLNYRISVIGEVVRPGNYSFSSDRISLLDALSMAGDMTIYGQRDRVAVIREIDGMRTIQYLDLKSKKIFESPYFYLQPKDIVYVEPNKRKAGMSEINQNNSVGIWLSITSTLVSVATLLISILR